MEYPKIDSLFKREGYDYAKTGIKPNGKQLLIGEYARPEFESICRWHVEEKIDGMNIRVMYEKQQGTNGPIDWVGYRGRTDNAVIPSQLGNWLRENLSIEKLAKQFANAQEVILFGEGYGPGIQQGDYYSKEQQFHLFDAVIDGYWLSKEKVKILGYELEIYDDLIDVGILSTQEIVEFVRSKPISQLALTQTNEKRTIEGVVARAHPLMFCRSRHPIMFKLKCKDMP